LDGFGYINFQTLEAVDSIVLLKVSVIENIRSQNYWVCTWKEK